MKQIGGDTARLQSTRSHLLGQFPPGLGHVPASTVICGDDQDQTGICGGAPFGLGGVILQDPGKRAAIADETQPNIGLIQAANFVAQGGYCLLYTSIMNIKL